MSVFGPTLVAARLPSVLASLALAIVIYRMGRSLYSERVGIASGFVFLVVPAVYWHSHAGRTATTDIFLVLFGTLFVWLLWEGRSRPQLVIWSAVAGGLAFLSKQLAVVQFLLVAIPILIVYWEEYSISTLLKATLAGLLVVLPWNLFALLTHTDMYLNQMIFEQVLSRTEQSSGLLNFYFVRRWPLYIGPFVLSTAVGIATVVHTTYRERVTAQTKTGALLIWWLLVPIGLFTVISSTSLIHYLLPTVVPVSILSGLTAGRITTFVEQTITDWWRPIYISDIKYLGIGVVITLMLFAIYPAHQAIRAGGG